MSQSHFMLDLETLGTYAGCSILSIGAVKFDPEYTFDVESYGSGVDNPFYRVINRSSCLQVGLFEDPETIDWWNKQSKEAREIFNEGQNDAVSLVEALSDFRDYLNSNSESTQNIRIWGCGSDFDNVILSAAYRAAGIPSPWTFWNNRCYRTLKSLMPDLKLERKGTHHNALDDARHQATHAVAIFNGLRK